uniref:Tf2-1-like SH3-like domain-containing protein n=1 Tax=Ananas comosus var. bracteatus TaxID=296719 RepID=A0A6V7PLU0_ANACO|nr:unnamed protein product [Ananas comosus var. bracteatus]
MDLVKLRHDDWTFETLTTLACHLCSFAHTCEGCSLQIGTPELAYVTYDCSCGIEKPTGSGGIDSFLEWKCWSYHRHLGGTSQTTLVQTPYMRRHMARLGALPGGPPPVSRRDIRVRALFDTVPDHTLDIREYCPSCPVRVGDWIMPVDLLVLRKLGDFDVALGMDWLTKYYATVDCKNRTVTFREPGQTEVVFCGCRSSLFAMTISSSRARQLISRGCVAYLASVVLRGVDDTLRIEDIPVVREFQDEFLAELPGPVAYQLALPPNLSGVHNVFHVSVLRKYVFDPTHVLDSTPLELRDDLSFEELPVRILAREVRKLRNRDIPYVKVLWSNHGKREAT